MAKKITDWDLYVKYFSNYESDCYWNGSYFHFNGLNPQTAKNMIFVDQEKYNSSQSSTNSLDLNESQEDVEENVHQIETPITESENTNDGNIEQIDSIENEENIGEEDDEFVETGI